MFMAGCIFLNSYVCHFLGSAVCFWWDDVLPLFTHDDLFRATCVNAEYCRLSKDLPTNTEKINLSKHRCYIVTQHSRYGWKKKQPVHPVLQMWPYSSKEVKSELPPNGSLTVVIAPHGCPAYGVLHIIVMPTQEEEVMRNGCQELCRSLHQR